jgi:hypothetical protein
MGLKGTTALLLLFMINKFFNATEGRQELIWYCGIPGGDVAVDHDNTVELLKDFHSIDMPDSVTGENGCAVIADASFEFADGIDASPGSIRPVLIMLKEIEKDTLEDYMPQTIYEASISSPS